MQILELTGFGKTYARKRGIRVVGKGNWIKQEVGKSVMKLVRLILESSGRNWKVRAEVGKLELKLESSS